MDREGRELRILIVNLASTDRQLVESEIRMQVLTGLTINARQPSR